MVDGPLTLPDLRPDDDEVDRESARSDTGRRKFTCHLPAKLRRSMSGAVAKVLLQIKKVPCHDDIFFTKLVLIPF